MSTKSRIACIAALATIIAAPAQAAPVKHTQRPVLSGADTVPFNFGRTTGPTSGHDWQLDGRLPVPEPYWNQ
jgi:hypothetical protein